MGRADSRGWPSGRCFSSWRLRCRAVALMAPAPSATASPVFYTWPVGSGTTPGDQHIQARQDSDILFCLFCFVFHQSQREGGREGGTVPQRPINRIQSCVLLNWSIGIEFSMPSIDGARSTQPPCFPISPFSWDYQHIFLIFRGNIQ